MDAGTRSFVPMRSISYRPYGTVRLVWTRLQDVARCAPAWAIFLLSLRERASCALGAPPKISTGLRLPQGTSELAVEGTFEIAAGGEGGAVFSSNLLIPLLLCVKLRPLSAV